MKLAGFIMTYERSEIIGGTIEKVFSQTIPPDKLLIVDNSESDKTKLLIESLGDERVEYLAVGYNSGPAGAAKIGLQRLSQEGYDWIYWGDDDDPPVFEDTFERLLDITKTSKKQIGIVGVVGHNFSKFSGEIKRMPDSELQAAFDRRLQFLEVDSIAGNQSMIVSAEVVRNNILPDPRLFFGFEELDFCLRTKNAGFNILVSPDLFQESRRMHNRLQFKQPIYVVQDLGKLHRNYYSIRNMLIILKTQRLYLGYIYQVFKGLMKALYGFRYGIHYGRINFNMMVLGLFDGLRSKYGRRF